MTVLDRRDLLRLLATAIATPAWIEACGGGPDPGALRASVAPSQRRWDRYEELGRRILDERVVETRPRALARALAETLSWEPGTTVEAATERLLETVRTDFAEGRVVAAGGWRLSRTEARVLALLATAPAVSR